MIERDLFGTIRLVRTWGFVGSKGQENVKIFPDEAKAAQALKSWATAQRPVARMAKTGSGMTGLHGSGIGRLIVCRCHIEQMKVADHLLRSGDVSQPS
jgi:hypothetical protein